MRRHLFAQFVEAGRLMGYSLAALAEPINTALEPNPPKGATWNRDKLWRAQHEGVVSVQALHTFVRFVNQSQLPIVSGLPTRWWEYVEAQRLELRVQVEERDAQEVTTAARGADRLRPYLRSFDRLAGLSQPFLNPLLTGDPVADSMRLAQVSNIFRSELFREDADLSKACESVVADDTVARWAHRSPNSWLVAETDNGQIEAYVHCELITKDMGDAIRRGESHEGQIATADILADDAVPDPSAYIHIGCWAFRGRHSSLRTRMSKNELFLRLLGGLARRVCDLGGGQPGRPYRVLAIDFPAELADEQFHNSTTHLNGFGFVRRELVPGRPDADGQDPPMPVLVKDILRPYDRVSSELIRAVAVAGSRG